MIRKIAGCVFDHANPDVPEVLRSPVRDAGDSAVFGSLDPGPISRSEGDGGYMQGELRQRWRDRDLGRVDRDCRGWGILSGMTYELAGGPGAAPERVSSSEGLGCTLQFTSF